MKNIDILISSSLKSSIGPVQTIRRIKDSHDFFLEEGYDVNVYTLDNFASSSAYAGKKKKTRINDIKRSIFRFLYLHTTIFPKMKFKKDFGISRAFLDKYFQLDRHPDALVFHSIFDCYNYLKYFKKEGVKVSLFIHDDGNGEMFFYYYPRMHGTNYEKEWERKVQYVFENIDVKACITRTTEKNLLKRAPVLQGKTCLVINGVSDLSEEQLKETEKIRLALAGPKFRIVETGSMNGRKGHRDVIEALHRTKAENLKQIRVSFVGGGYEKQKLESLVRKYKLESVVSFDGIVPNNEVYKYLAKANIAILISVMEGLPLALIEGLRSGLGIISTRVSGIPEIVNEGEDRNGVLINPDVNELVDVFNSLGDYDWESMGKASRKLFENYYNFPRMREDYRKMLNKLTEEK